ncbi:hypothetical protein AB0785_004121 [Escherichia coli]
MPDSAVPDNPVDSLASCNLSMLVALNYDTKRLAGINRKQSRHISPTISQGR